MKIIYRISDAGYNKVKPDYINNENCLKNFTRVFRNYIDDITVIADNPSEKLIGIISSYVDPKNVQTVNVGHGAGTFNLALDLALTFDANEIVYFVENDYLHREGSDKILLEGIQLGAYFVTLYDHPDKYLPPNQGGNPHCIDGAEHTKVYLTPSTHWKITNSTTMTFSAKVSTLRLVEPTLRQYTSGTHPYDFQMFTDLFNQGYSLVTPIPGYSTHGETRWLAPLINWEEVQSGIDK